VVVTRSSAWRQAGIFLKKCDRVSLGSARVSCIGERVLAIANFPCAFPFYCCERIPKKRLFRRDAETSTRDACATPEKFSADLNENLAIAIRSRWLIFSGAEYNHSETLTDTNFVRQLCSS